MMANLWNTYIEVSFLISPSLQEFIDQVLAGKHGCFSKAEIVEFLHKMEAAIHSNIELMAEANPSVASLVEGNRKEISDEITRLIEMVKSR